MAHNLNRHISGEYSFYSRKEKAWHGLGQIISDCNNAEQALKYAHLDFNVDVQPVYVNVGISEPLDWEYNDMRIVPNTRATYRTDTGEVFGSVGDRYEVIQNDKFLDFIFEIFRNPGLDSRDKVTIETAGALGKGEQVFVTASMPGYVKLSNNEDVAEKYIVVTSSHDGSGMFTALLTNVRVVCNNTLSMALGGMKNFIKFKHTKNVHDNIKDAQKLMGFHHQYTDQMQLAFDAMLHKEINEKTAIEYIAELCMTKQQLDTFKFHKFNMDSISNDTISTRLRNKMQDIQNFMDKGCGQEYNRGTLYWLYQGVNSYINNGVVYKNQEEKFKTLTTGTGYNQSQKAFDLALTLL